MISKQQHGLNLKDHVNTQTDLNIATMMKDTRVTEQPCLKDAPFIQQVGDRVCILQHQHRYVTKHNVSIDQLLHYSYYLSYHDNS